ncbi:MULTISPECIES: hypothetical protein [Bradyrhizobium]|uniref:Uncharacterized protein n=1 Tax=Bradyrhizobium elkanii TaxID=29448 RepID=A0A4U6RSE9_BRAEL|nr:MULTISPECIES: hypothetical protein [Bradyrhizobium]MTV11728.1 hypothetical protein [Bradyrhizobium sp. BR2003]TKV77789.1 hypothetical protein FDV58_29865 [Bradyrhizobium elkanii]
MEGSENWTERRGGAPVGFTSERVTKTAQSFLDLVIAPLLMRAVFGDDPKALRAHIRTRVAEARVVPQLVV